MANDTYDRETDDPDGITIRIEGAGHGNNVFVPHPEPEVSRFDIWQDPKLDGDSEPED